jgi:cytochrome P450
MMRYGETWRSHRRVMRQNFHPKDTTDFERKQLKSTHELLSNLVNNPRDSFAHVRLCVKVITGTN